MPPDAALHTLARRQLPAQLATQQRLMAGMGMPYKRDGGGLGLGLGWVAVVIA
jgi:hypothetical protein